MVTLQEVEEREEELKKLEVESKNISTEPIPQRRYGFGITQEIQKKYISRRAEAKNIIVKIGEQREQLKQTRLDIAENDRIKAEYESKAREYADYQQGRKIALNGGAYGVFALEKNNKAMRQGFVDATDELRYGKARANYLKQLADLKAQGLKPVYADGKLTGFEDLEKKMSIPLESIPGFLQQNPSEIKRYEQAKLIEVKTSEVNLKEQLLRTDYLTKETIDTFRPKGSLQRIPITQVYYVNPTTLEKRKATQEEQDYYNRQRVLQASADTGFMAKINEFFTTNKVAQRVAKPSLLIEDLGRVNPEGTEGIIKFFEPNIDFVDKQGRQRVTDIGGELNFLQLTMPIPTAKVPLRVTIPERALARESFSPEAAVKVIRAGKEERLAAFDIYTEIKPPRIELIRKKGTGLLDALEIRKDSLYTKTKPTGLVKGENPYLSISAKNLRYTKVGSIEEITPIETRFVSLQEIKSLPKIDQYLFQKLAETKTGGRPVALKNINKILSKEDLYIRGVMEVRSKGRVKAINRKSLELEGSRKKPGTLTNKYLTLSSVKKTGETKYLELYDIKTIFKDVTKPLSRAAGKPSFLNTKLAELKEPIVLDTEGVNFISPASITKTPMSRTFSEQVLKSIMAKAPPKVPRVRSLPKIKAEQEFSKIYPISLSQYSGTGLYERTEGGNIPGEKLPTLERAKPSFNIKTIPLEKQVHLSYEGQRNRPSLKEESMLKNIMIEKNIMKEKNLFKEVSIEKEILKQRQVQKQKQVLKQKEIIKPVEKINPPKIPRINIPKVPGKAIPRIDFNISGGAMGKEVPGYLPFVLKKGKKVYLGGLAPRGKALSIAEREAKETLRATFGAEKTKFKVKGKDVNFTPEKSLFRSFKIKKGKKVPLVNTFIQKLGKRLSFKKEVIELQSYRRNK